MIGQSVVSYSTEAIEIFLAEDLTHAGDQQLDHGEFVDVDTMHFPDVLAAATERIDDPAMQLFLAPAVLHELDGEPVEQFRMRRRFALRAQIF